MTVARLVDIALALLIVAVGIGDVAGGDLDPEVLWLAGAVVSGAVLLWRRRFPLAVLVGVIAPWMALSLTNPPADPVYPFFAIVVAVFSAGAHAELRRAAIALILALAFFAVGSAVDDTTSLGDVVFVDFFLLGAWMLGRVLRGRTRYATALEAHAERLEVDRDAQARAAVVIERARIARELHDVIAHGISVMVLQAGGVRRRLGPDQARESDALQTVESTGREALGELRLLLGMLRAGDAPSDPERGLAHLDDLVASVRAAGLAVTVEVSGECGGLPRALDLSAYRIVQEALTNALKHAGAGHAHVSVRHGRRRLELEISDDGAGVAPSNGGGHGLIGMRERVAMFGGSFEAGARPDGGFAVRAQMPIEGPAA